MGKDWWNTGIIGIRRFSTQMNLNEGRRFRPLTTFRTLLVCINQIVSTGVWLFPTGTIYDFPSYRLERFIGLDGTTHDA